jgi:hypothetical protein
LDRLVPFHQEERKSARISASLFATCQHYLDLGAAVGDKALDAIDTPYASLVVVRSPRLHRTQVGASIWLGEDHGTSYLPPSKAGQDPRSHLITAEIMDRGGNLLQTEDGHQPSLGSRYDLDHHLIDRLRQIHPAILPGQHHPHQLSLFEGLQCILGSGSIAHFAVLKLYAFFIRLGGPRSNHRSANLTQHLK